MADKQKGVRILPADRREFILGVIFVLFSFTMPFLLNVQNFQISVSLTNALTSGEKAGLLKASVLLVLLNSLRGIPHYVGAFFIGESVKVNTTWRLHHIPNALLTVVVLLLTYRGIEAVHHIRYDFGIPAIMVSAFVILFGHMDYRYISLPKKAALVILVLTAFQFLDIMPIMRHLPVGRGETSFDIKQAAIVLDAESLLDVAGAVGMLLFASFGMLILFQLRDENTLRELNALKEQNEEIRMQSRIIELQNRMYQEMQYLVHDLKSPLTAIQAMTGVLRIQYEQGEYADSSQNGEYFNRIELAVDQMSSMISEILYKDRKSRITTDAILKVVLAQASVTEHARYLHVKNEVPEIIIRANRILFPRALSNLLQNAAQAVKDTEIPEINLCVTKENDDGESRICFAVSDNGTGIPKAMQECVWDRGVSGVESSGLGLVFVKNVVTDMGGTISLYSRENEGSKFMIWIPEDDDNGE